MTEVGRGWTRILVIGMNGEATLRAVYALNAPDVAAIRGGEPLIVCSQGELDLEEAAKWPVVLFPARTFLGSTQAHTGAPQTLDDLAARMTSSLACILNDMWNFVSTQWTSAAHSCWERIRMAFAAHPDWREQGRFGDFALAVVMTAVMAIARAYAHWAPLGRRSLHQYREQRGVERRAGSRDGMQQRASAASVPSQTAMVLFLQECLTRGHQGPN